MKLCILVNTAAQAYTWSNLARKMRSRGDDVVELARDYGPTIQILEARNIPYIRTYAADARNLARLAQFLTELPRLWEQCRSLSPDLILGFGVDAAIIGALVRRPSVVLMDTEGLPFQLMLTVALTSAIVTPECFLRNLGAKQVRFAGYKELAYLHPNYFTPDPGVLSGLGVKPYSKLAVLRFNAFDAVHDIGSSGFTLNEKRKLVAGLLPHARVLISSEEPLPEDLEDYRLELPPHRIHDLLACADIFVSDTGTMATEAALLGTPTVVCGNFAEELGNFKELRDRYQMISSHKDPTKAIEAAVDLIQRPGAKEDWTIKRNRLLGEKVDVTAFLVSFVESFSGRANPTRQTSSDVHAGSRPSSRWGRRCTIRRSSRRIRP